jgi:hypothetical protein
LKGGRQIAHPVDPFVLLLQNLPKLLPLLPFSFFLAFEVQQISHENIFIAKNLDLTPFT